MFWRRLDALSDPDAKPLAKAARRPVDAPKREKAPEVAKRPRSSPAADCGPRVDAETMRRNCERLWGESLQRERPETLRGEKPGDPRVTVVADELEACAELATTSGAGERGDLAKELAEELATLRAAPAAPSSGRGGDLAKELAEELAKARARLETPTAEELDGGAAVMIVGDELEAFAGLAELAESGNVYGARSGTVRPGARGRRRTCRT